MAASKSTANLSDGTDSVDIIISKLEESDVKDLIVLPMPSKNLGAGTVLTWLVDLQKLRQVITITGFLVDETGSSSYSKKNSLKNLKKRAGTMTLTWKEDNAGSQVDRSETVNILKDQITMVAGRVGDSSAVLSSPTQGAIYQVMLQLAVGTHKG